MHRLAGFAVLFLAGGCLREKVQYCNNGAYCPEPLVCTERTEGPFCGGSVEVGECLGKAEEAECNFEGDATKKGYCSEGLCKLCDPNNAACIYEGWTAMQAPVSTDLYALWVAGPRDVYVAGKAGAFARWDGRAWTLLPPPPGAGVDIRGFAGLSSSDIWASIGANLYHFDGTAWSTPAVAPNAVLGLFAVSPNQFFSSGFAATTGRNNGSWVFTQNTLGLNSTLTAVGGKSSTDVFAVGSSGTVLHWNGSMWSQQTTPGSYGLQAVFEVSPTRIYATGRTAGGTPAVLFSDSTWMDQTSLLPASVRTAAVILYSVWADDTYAFAVGDSGTILRSQNGNWEQMPSNTAAILTGVGGTGRDVFAVGNAGVVLRYRFR